MVDILRVSVTGLNAARTGMATTSHNIANVNTPYYSRQRIEQGTQTPEKYPYGYMGRGTDIESISRSIDEFVMKQMRGHTSGVSQYEELNDLTGQLSALLGDTEVGLTPDLEAFFGSLQDLADSPTSIPARQVLLDQAQTLTSRTEDINSALTDLRNAVDTGITNAVTAINDLSAGIAKINQDITLSQSAPGTQPNDLLDNRDRMLADLSELVNVQVLTQKDGSVSVFMGSGQPLVVSNSAFKLEAVQSGFDPQEITVRLEGQTEGSDLERYVTSGALGGYFEFRRDILNPAQDGLGLLAMGLAETFNEQHQRGLDLDGALGENLFTAGSPKVLAHSTNEGDALFSAALNNTSGPYQLSYDGTDYTLTRLSDNQIVADNFTLGSNQYFSADGITIGINSGSIVNNGDQFLLQPDAEGNLSVQYNGNGGTTDIQFGARTISTTDSSQLIRSDYEILTSGMASRASYTNAGNATISAPVIVDADNENFTDNVSIQFITPTTYKVVDNTTNQRIDGGVDQTYTSGATIPPTGSYNGWTVKITNGSTPIIAGDTFEISAGYTVNRLVDGQEILKDGDFTALNDVMRAQGLHLSLTDTPPGSPPRYEDRFLIQPTRNGAAPFDVNLIDPRKVAAAGAITTTAWADNVSTAAISAGTVVDAKNPNLKICIRIQFTSTNTFDVLDLTAGATLATGVTYSSGKDIAYNGWSSAITGAPQGNVGGDPVTTSAKPTNQGSATIAVTGLTNLYDEALLNNVEIRFTSATEFDVFDVTTGTTLQSGVSYTSGGNISANGWTVQVTDGASGPQTGDAFQIKNDGDAFVIKNNQGGMGDNRNALKLVELETEPQLMGGNDYRGVYNTLIAEVGAQGRRVESTLQSQEALLEQSTMTRESISGVNLDEEAANLVRFQQAYEASAQMIQVANSLFSTLLAAVRS